LSRSRALEILQQKEMQFRVFKDLKNQSHKWRIELPYSGGSEITKSGILVEQSLK
jgi:hypothetical protein